MSNISSISKRQLIFKIFYASLLLFIALVVPAFLVQNFPLFDNYIYNHITKAICVGVIVIIGIRLFRQRLDKGIPAGIGVNNSKTAFKYLLIGIGLILIPLLVTLVISSVFEWANFRFNFKGVLISTLFLGLISTLFTDALSEELVFRGYIFSNLKEHYNLWISSAITLTIFVIAPVFIITIQNSLQVDGAVALSGNYIINMILFGAFMQYLRIIFNSIWVGVGFHLIFVHMNQLMGTTSDKLLQFSEDSNQQAVQFILMSFLVLTFLGLIIYPLIKRKKRNKKMLKTL